MANNVIIRRIEVAEDYQPLSDRDLIGTFDISTPPFNPGPVFFLGDDGSDVPSIAGEVHTFKSTNLRSLKAKGAPGCIITVIGGTWRD